MFPFNPILEAQASYLRLNLSPAERLLEDIFRKNFPQYHLEAKVPIDDYIVDFFIKEKKLAVEIDMGQQENTDAYVYHAERKEKLESLGIKVVRIEETEIFNETPAVIKKLITAFQ